ncbi:YihA family ribosome biogenesis GTP-binding protein [archaeon]|nr:MAG: YihA family ribosome biogenesis GTP-binding protein [archaeon]
MTVFGASFATYALGGWRRSILCKYATRLYQSNGSSIFTYSFLKGTTAPLVEEVDNSFLLKHKSDAKKIFSLNPTYIPPSYFNHQLPSAGRPEVAFVGRSNVGKSSLVEALLGTKGLLRISKEPGCTTTLNYYALAKGSALDDHACYLIDMPGYGFAKIAKQQQKKWLEIVNSYLMNRDQLLLRRVFVLIDSRRGVQMQDVEMMEMLNHAHIPYQVVLTKKDLVSDKEIKEKLFELFCVISRKKNNSCLPLVHVVSALKGLGLEDLRLSIVEIVCR